VQAQAMHTATFSKSPLKRLLEWPKAMYLANVIMSPFEQPMAMRSVWMANSETKVCDACNTVLISVYDMKGI
jgi:hypothetical protein